MSQNEAEVLSSASLVHTNEMRG